MHAFTRDSEIEAIGLGLIDRTLPKPQWTHAAHVAAAVWILRARPDLDATQVMPGLIRAYNQATGVANTDTDGYHETITQASLRATAALLDRLPPEAGLAESVNAVLATPLGEKDWLLAYWRRETLYSVEARRAWIEPDLRQAPF